VPAIRSTNARRAAAAIALSMGETLERHRDTSPIIAPTNLVDLAEAAGVMLHNHLYRCYRPSGSPQLHWEDAAEHMGLHIALTLIDRRPVTALHEYLRPAVQVAIEAYARNPD
jgi:hypothetical protein